ncbi:MAG TPA: sigma-54-dependent Fis family transcriptional regulator [Bryobacteraceae bacterium]|nr:sigma-54-dependent Fis family transcriptional regulator [Bryobacteraceae bacterium]
MSPSSEADRSLERIVFEYAERVAGKSGDDFFGSLLRLLVGALDADYVFIGVLQPDGERVATIATQGPGAEAAAAEYTLAGTPCANVIAGQACSYPSGVQQSFPQDVRLAKSNAQGYVGAPIMDSSGRCRGLLCAVTKHRLANAKFAEALLKIFATRTGTELERKNYEDSLAHSEERFRAFVDHSNEGVVWIKLEQPVSIDAPEDEQIDHYYRYAYVADCNDQAAKLFGLARAEQLIGARFEAVSPRSDPEQIERLRAGIRNGWNFSQVERTLLGRHLLMTRRGVIENGLLQSAWLTARDITALKQAEAEVLRLNEELKSHLDQLTALQARLEQDNAYLLDEIRTEHNVGEMVGASPKFRDLIDRIHLVASTSATVMITGETGTGKELVARAIHNLSPRSSRPLVKVNCAAIAAGLVESELFGHVKGAFTGATDRRMGRFEYADGGTLFLDEITELPLDIQAKLLRVLQEQEFEPVGSNRTMKVDVRLLAATNRNLSELIHDGRLRVDLYYRLMVVPVDVPPLRERRDDIPLLASHFVKRVSRQFGRHVERISERMMRELIAYDWPGNIRELENFLARAIVLCPGDTLDMPLNGIELTQPASARSRSLEDAERQHIESVLASTGWVIEGPNGAAAVLKMNPSTLRSRLRRLGIKRPQHSL